MISISYRPILLVRLRVCTGTATLFENEKDTRVPKIDEMP
jgi:hypothetical protein